MATHSSRQVTVHRVAESGTAEHTCSTTSFWVLTFFLGITNILRVGRLAFPGPLI